MKENARLVLKKCEGFILKKRSDMFMSSACFFWLASVGMTCLASAWVGKVMCSILGPNRLIAKDIKRCTYIMLLSQMRDINSPSRGNALPKNRHYHAQLGLLDKGCAIKG